VLAQAGHRGCPAASGALGPARERLRSVLVNGFLQQRMVQREWRPGVMHAVIFLGFMSLLIRKVQLLAIGYSEGFVWPETFGGPFAAFKDGVEVAVTLAVLYGFYRRFVRARRGWNPTAKPSWCWA
jgi:hypothetical protein